MTDTRLQPISQTPAGARAEQTAVRLVTIRKRRRLPLVVAGLIGLGALVLAVGLLAPTTSGLTEKLAQVCSAAGSDVPADARHDCAQAQRGEVPVRAAGVPGFDGAVADTPVTVPPVRPGAPATIIYPPDAGLPGVLPTALPALPPGAVVVPGPVITVTSVPPRETVTVAAPVPAAGTETQTVTVAGPPPERETVTERADPPPPETRTETVTVTEPPPGPPPGEQQPPPVTTSGDPSPAPGPAEQPPADAPASPVAASGPSGQDPVVLARLLGFGLGLVQ